MMNILELCQNSMFYKDEAVLATLPYHPNHIYIYIFQLLIIVLLPTANPDL